MLASLIPRDSSTLSLHFFTQLFSCVLTIIHNASSKAVKWSYVVCSEEHELDSRRLKTALGEFDENAAK